MILGALALVVAASLYASASMLVKFEAPRLNLFAHNAYRLVVAAVAMAAVFLATRPISAITSVSLPTLLALVGAVFCGLTIGDTLSYRAIMLIGLGRAFPICNVYPLLTTLVAVVWMGEVVGPKELVGGVVTLVGVTLVALRVQVEAERRLDSRTNLLGVGLAAGAACLWAMSNVLLRLAMLGTDPITGNTIRLPLAALVGLVILRVSVPDSPPPWRWSWRTRLTVATTGLLSSVIAGVLTLYGVQEVGAARASIVGSTSPIFGAPLATAFLKERLTGRIIVGTLLSVGGVILVVA